MGVVVVVAVVELVEIQFYDCQCDLYECSYDIFMWVLHI